MNTNETKVIASENDDSQTQIVIPIKNTSPKKIVCEVCGYANPEYTAQCKKCSNYLQRS